MPDSQSVPKSFMGFHSPVPVEVPVVEHPTVEALLPDLHSNLHALRGPAVRMCEPPSQAVFFARP